jgi:hypothetical protein
VVTAAAVWSSRQAVDVAWCAVVLGTSLGILVYLALLRRWLRPRLSGRWLSTATEVSAAAEAPVPIAP